MPPGNPSPDRFTSAPVRQARISGFIAIGSSSPRTLTPRSAVSAQTDITFTVGTIKASISAASAEAFLAEQAADRRQPEVGVETQHALGDGTEAASGPAAQSLGDQQSDPGQTEAEHHRAGQLRQGGVVQRRGGQAAEQQGRKQDEVVDALGAGPELLAGKGPQTQEITSNDQREQRPEGQQKGGHGYIQQCMWVDLRCWKRPVQVLCPTSHSPLSLRWSGQEPSVMAR